jgi:hypothetical protein
MGSGDPPGLQNRRVAGFPVTGVFDSHTLPPFAFNRSKRTARGLNRELVAQFSIKRDEIVNKEQESDAVLSQGNA